MNSTSPYLHTSVLWLMLGSTTVAAPIVELNVVPSSRAPVTAAQDWVRALAQLKSVRVRSANVRAAKPEVKRSGNTVNVTAVIGSDNELKLPGKSFSISQVPAIQAWIEIQRSGGPVEQAKDRFGLSTAQVQQVHDALKVTIDSATKDQNAVDVIAAIAAKTGHAIRFSGSTRDSLRDVSVTSELQGFASGTALAMVLRSAEQVFFPRVTPAGEFELVVVREGGVAESWPVGWETSLKQQEVVPKLFDYLEIEITETPIRQVLTAVESRIATPFFYDEALLAVLKLDLAETKVSIPAGRTTYSRLMRQAVFQARLKSELRVDERGKPFYWVTPTIRRSLTDRK